MIYQINYFQPRSTYARRFNLLVGGYSVSYENSVKGFRTFPDVIRFAKSLHKAKPSFYSEDYGLTRTDVAAILKKADLAIA